MNYVLKRKDEIITIINFADDGSVYKFYEKLVNPELAPLHDANDFDWLKQWWKRRSIPISQGNIRQMLEKKGLLGPEDFLLKNLGLSLTDYYWISPLDSGMTWKDVNLFDNDFHGNILLGESEDENYDEMLLSIKTESFASDELKLLELVSDRSLLDITKLPSRSFIEEIYSMDSQIDEKRISLIGEGYERKIELFRAYQLGQDLHKIKLAVKDYRKPTINTEEFLCH